MNSKIIINKPCHQNWNTMSPEEQGRHCSACNKVVQDFTKMKTEEIIDKLKNTKGEVCGRIGVNKLTAANQKQKVWFWLNGVVLRKAVYPLMALLGVTLLTKKAQAQVGDYHVKGKMDTRDYHTNDKKLNVVVKNNEGVAISDAGIRIISGVVKEPKGLTTDETGRVTFILAASNLLNNTVEIEVLAPGYETKILQTVLIKDIQTVEIRMDYEMMMMGEMMYVPDEKIEEPKVIAIDSIPKIEVCKCDFKDIKDLKIVALNDIIIEDRIDLTDNIDTSATIEKMDENTVTNSEFILFPNPSTDFVTIQYSGKENFNLDIFDGNGKKIHAVVNSNERYLLDLTKYSAGIYYALITIEGRAVETKKIIVTR